MPVRYSVLTVWVLLPQLSSIRQSWIPSLTQPINQSTHPPINQPTNQSKQQNVPTRFYLAATTTTEQNKRRTPAANSSWTEVVSLATGRFVLGCFSTTSSSSSPSSSSSSSSFSSAFASFFLVTFPSFLSLSFFQTPFGFGSPGKWRVQVAGDPGGKQQQDNVDKNWWWWWWWW